MPRYNVQSGDEWACFSSVPDEFITAFMPLDDYEAWRDLEYGRQKIPLEQANKKSLAAALRSLSVAHSDEEILAHLREVGLLYPKEDEE